MIRNLKAAGLALLALFAMSALSASTASANNDVFTVGGPSAILTGFSHDNKISIAGTSFQCTTARFAGTVLNNATSMTVDMAYAGRLNVAPHTTHCASPFGDITWDMNGCTYTLTGSTTKEDPPALGKDAVVSIECPVGQVIRTTNTSTGTTISIPPQTPTTGGVTYTNLPNHPGGAAIRVNTTITGITYTCAPAFTCSLSNIPTHGNNATSLGTVDLTGYKDNNAVNVLTPANEGTRVPISVTTTP